MPRTGTISKPKKNHMTRGPSITLAVATLKDLKAVATYRENHKNQPVKGEQRTLVFIPSKLERSKIYREMENILEAHEIQVLSPHGNRPWKCTVKISDPPKSKKGPLFRYRKGKLELATLPYLIGKINQQQTEDLLAQEAADASRYPQVHVSRAWISPLNVRYSSRKSALEASAELVRRDHHIRKLLLGLGIRGNLLLPRKPARKQALEAGKYRFERDGIWIIGQEEQWQLNRSNELLIASVDKRVKQQSTKIEVDIETHEECDVEEGQSSIGVQVSPSSNGLKGDSSTNGTNKEHAKWTRFDLAAVGRKSDTIKRKDIEMSGYHALPSFKVPKTKICGTRGTSGATFTGEGHSKAVEKSEPPLLSLVTVRQKNFTVRAVEFRQSLRIRLTEDQIDLCYRACMEQYEKVVYTVKARGLHEELASGFDVFRERGRGRFDLQIDVFDLPQFSFLTSNDAPWIEALWAILGKDAVLIHKGSETQKYHQDGVHLNNHVQKPCHAVNVFIPLVNLTLNNGPTEFCLGSHILGWEGFRRENAEIPLLVAGSAVIFDYRLGHRGLGNTSQGLRPIVYLTYTRSGSTFKDHVNFSRKRYRRLGIIAQQPPSREERALRRTLQGTCDIANLM